jgi:hypothetical protein
MNALDIWQSKLTEEICELAMARILDGGNLATRSDIPKRTIKLALILVRTLNPLEDLSEEEFSLAMGVTRPTLRKMRQQKEFIQVINR